MAVIPQKQIKRDDLDAQISILSDELEVKRAGITAIIEREDKVKAEELALEDSKRVFEEGKRSAHSILDKRTQGIIEREKNHEKVVEDTKVSLDDLQRQIKQVTKELAKLNNSCINAAHELDTLNEQKSILENKVLELSRLVMHFEEMKVKIKDAEEKKLAIDIEVESKQSALKLEVENAKRILELINKEVTQKVDEKDKAEYALKAYTDQLYTSMNDWQIIRSRLEVKWKEHYPELDLPIE